jgi:CRP/FNR family transcriptional regulator, cyclic AMP receptor protein
VVAAHAHAAGAAEDFLGALDAEDAAALREAGVVRKYARGHALMYEGQVPDRVLVLRAGRVKVTRTTPGGREVVLAFRGPGELVGEQSALDDEPRGANVVAVEPIEVLIVAAARFRALLLERPRVTMALLRMLSRRLRDADAKRTEFTALTTIERVAVRLLELAQRFGEREPDGSVRIALPLSQEELAGATGASLESVGRALQTLRAVKCIETRRREIRVLDVEALEALRGAAA